MKEHAMNRMAMILVWAQTQPEGFFQDAVEWEFDMCGNGVCAYLRQACEMGYLKRERARRADPFFYTLLSITDDIESTYVKREPTNQEYKQTIRRVPAQQVGMERPWYLACLYGAAGGAGATA